MTRGSVTDEQYGKLSKRVEEVKRRVDEGTLPFGSIMDGLQGLIQGRQDGRPIWAISPKSQLALVHERNLERGWGFTEADFKALGDPPEWPEGRFCTVVLDVSLNTVQDTFEEAWYFVASAASAPSDSWRDEHIRSNPEHLRLLPDIEHRRGLRWQVVDLGAHWDKSGMGISPKDVRSSMTSPSSAILWAASYFPEWMQVMDGRSVPFVWLSGYQLATPHAEQPWWDVPVLHRMNKGEIRLSARFDYTRAIGMATPALLEQ